MFDNSKNMFEYKFFKQLSKDDMWFTNSDRFKKFVRIKSVKKNQKKKGKK